MCVSYHNHLTNFQKLRLKRNNLNNYHCICPSFRGQVQHIFKTKIKTNANLIALKVVFNLKIPVGLDKLQ